MHNILHITNEITKKNFSISSLINFIVTNSKNSKNKHSKVLCSESDKSLIIKKKYLIIKKIQWINFRKFKKIFFNEFNKYDLIHVHGIWAPIQIFSIIRVVSFNYSKKKLSSSFFSYQSLITIIEIAN